MRPDTTFGLKVRRWESRQAKRAAKVKQQKASAAAWRALSAAVKARDGATCQVCGQPTKTSGYPGHLGAAHHIIYRSHGRDDSLSNLLWVCGECHDAVHAGLRQIIGTAEKFYIREVP